MFGRNKYTMLKDYVEVGRKEESRKNHNNNRNSIHACDALHIS